MIELAQTVWLAVTVKAGAEVTVIAAEVLVLVSDGVDEMILIRYPLPAAVPPGIVAVIVPADVDVKVPIAVGLANEPDELDNCAVNTLPDV